MSCLPRRRSVRLAYRRRGHFAERRSQKRQRVGARHPIISQRALSDALIEEVRFAADFVWGFSCQAVVLGFGIGGGYDRHKAANREPDSPDSRTRVLNISV